MLQNLFLMFSRSVYKVFGVVLTKIMIISPNDSARNGIIACMLD